MTLHRELSRTLSLLGAAAVAVAATACDKQTGGVTSPNPARAYYRYVNAVPDTSGLDFRFVDTIDDSQPWANVLFRQFTPYQATPAGARRIRIFTNPSTYNFDAAVAQQVVLDTTLNLEVGQYYTIMHVGYARSGSTPRQRLVLIADQIPTPSAGNIAIRTINAAIGQSALDVYIQPDGTTPFSTAAAASSVPVLGSASIGVTSYLQMPARPQGAATSTYRFLANPAGSKTTPAYADVSTSVVGAAPLNSSGAVGGVQYAGSVLTAVVFPAAVAGSKAATPTSNLTPTVLLMVDRNPPLTP
jgi:hypothetical protein